MAEGEVKKYADVIIDIAHEKVDRPFSYKVPAELEDELQVGSAVQVPFGNGNRVRTGYIIGFSDKPSCDPSLVRRSQERRPENSLRRQCS